MVGREHDRVPLVLEVRYRTASSFLVAYSLNLSKGGAFLETSTTAAPGTPLLLKLEVPGAGAVELAATVSWVRDSPGPSGEAPAGMGVEFDDIDAALGAVIDELVAAFQGLTVLLYCVDSQERASLARMIRSILSTADVVESGGALAAEKLLGDDIDLVVIDIEDAGDAAWTLLGRARDRPRPVPTVFLAETAAQRNRARERGADAVTAIPPAYRDLQRAMLAALGRPALVR